MKMHRRDSSENEHHLLVYVWLSVCECLIRRTHFHPPTFTFCKKAVHVIHLLPLHRTKELNSHQVAEIAEWNWNFLFFLFFGY